MDRDDAPPKSDAPPDDSKREEDGGETLLRLKTIISKTGENDSLTERSGDVVCICRMSGLSKIVEPFVSGSKIFT